MLSDSYEVPEGYEFSQSDLEVKTVEDDAINKISVSDLGGLTAESLIAMIRDVCNDIDPSQVIVQTVFGDCEVEYLEFFKIRQETPKEYYRRLDEIRMRAMSEKERELAYFEANKAHFDALARIRQRSIRNQLTRLGVDPDQLESK